MDSPEPVKQWLHVEVSGRPSTILEVELPGEKPLFEEQGDFLTAAHKRGWIRGLIRSLRGTISMEGKPFTIPWSATRSFTWMEPR